MLAADRKISSFLRLTLVAIVATINGMSLSSWFNHQPLNGVSARDSHAADFTRQLPQKFLENPLSNSFLILLAISLAIALSYSVKKYVKTRDKNNSVKNARDRIIFFCVYAGVFYLSYYSTDDLAIL